MIWTDTFWTNPQYRVTVVDPDEGDADNTGALVVALLQKERRLKRTEGCELLTMGYAIYKVNIQLTLSFIHHSGKRRFNIYLTRHSSRLLCLRLTSEQVIK